MTFTQPHFLIFALFFFSIWPQLKGDARKYFLVGSSYLFYGYWSLGFLALLIGTTIIDFYVARWVHAEEDAARRKRLISISIVANLAVLGFFKYFNFFVDSAGVVLRAAGLDVSPRTLDIVLPVGISFYTFLSMSYTIDVYRRQLIPAARFLDFALYTSFFPQLVAGPIERGTHLLPQAQAVGVNERPSDPSGWGFIALGAFKKVVIADHLSGLVEATYRDPSHTWGPAMWIGTYAFAAQIYCDFSGYSDIAVGLGRLMGFDIMQNFRAPYCSEGPSEFWRRWHISLSSWLRDYLYIPLGGNRNGPGKRKRNLFLTMLLGGLWHGAAWNYVLWGAFHGALLILFKPDGFKRLADRLSGSRAARIAVSFFRRFFFFHLVCLSWALFRAQSLSDCGAIFSRLFGLKGWRWNEWLSAVHASGEGRYLAFSMAIVLGVVLVQNVTKSGPDALVARVWRLPQTARVLFVVVLLAAVVLLSPEKPPPFIYFQF